MASFASNIPLSVSSLTPLKLVRTYEPAEWEEFIAEWAEGFDPPYKQILHLGGAGDKGRDVIAYLGDPTDPKAEWDSYQCKHYAKTLTPTNIYVELGKLCVFTHRGDYTVPRRYKFAAPWEVGTKLHDLLKKPTKLREELILNWDKYCRNEISEAESFPLVGSLKAYVESFDFSIVWFLTTNEILTQHQRTKHWFRRFKIEPPTRPPVEPPPLEIHAHELLYTTRLFEAYSDCLKKPITCHDELTGCPDHLEHFHRSRGFFFSAEALARFSRDNFPAGAFDSVKKQLLDGVGDVLQEQHPDGYQCVLKVTREAAQLPLAQSDLSPHVEAGDRKGICHHLANDGKLRWVRP